MSTAIPTPLSHAPREVPADAGRRLDYRHLAAVHAVARAGRLTRAAEALKLAPPTLSAQFTALTHPDRYGPNALAQVASGTRRRVLRAEDRRDAPGSPAARRAAALEALTEAPR